MSEDGLSSTESDSGSDAVTYAPSPHPESSGQYRVAIQKHEHYPVDFAAFKAARYYQATNDRLTLNSEENPDCCCDECEKNLLHPSNLSSTPSASVVLTPTPTTRHLEPASRGSHQPKTRYDHLAVSSASSSDRPTRLNRRPIPEIQDVREAEEAGLSWWS